MAYSAPTLAELRTIVARSLSDTSGVTFQPAELTDFINEGISELNRSHPIEDTLDLDASTSPPWLVDDVWTYIWRVELAFGGEVPTVVVPPDTLTQSRTGWSFYGGRVWLGDTWVSRVADLYEQYSSMSVFAFGYRNRQPLGGDTEVPEFIRQDDESGVRKYARVMGLRALASDRSLFQQWLAATNNTDLSINQLGGMLAQAEGDWDKFISRYYLIRRTPEGYDV